MITYWPSRNKSMFHDKTTSTDELSFLSTVQNKSWAPKLVDAAWIGGQEVMIVTEKLPGKTISEAMSKILLSRKETKYKIVDSLVAMINDLHSLKIVHGDIHGDNVIIDSNNQVYLIDYDMSFNIGESSMLKSLFIPPEGLSDYKSYRADITYDYWCLGLLIYKIIYGIDSPMKIYRSDVNDFKSKHKIFVPYKSNPHILTPYNNLLSNLLCLDPKLRKLSYC